MFSQVEKYEDFRGFEWEFDVFSENKSSEFLLIFDSFSVEIDYSKWKEKLENFDIMKFVFSSREFPQKNKILRIVRKVLKIEDPL